MASISRLEHLKELHSNAFCFNRGIERETLRVDQDGHLSQTQHPKGLGSALTHSAITTDYSESLLEFITTVHTDKKALIQELDELHRYSYSTLERELFWSASMPSVLPAQEQIPIAQYGDSNIGRLKTIYRHGLWHRYGRKMQTIAGLHYNWSLTDEFWRQWALVNGVYGDLTPFKTEEYFGLIRNFRRHSWLLLYLFGASPAADQSFVDTPIGSLENLNEQTVYGPYATSLRMSDLGYSNQAQAELFVCFNSLESYAKTLSEAIQSPYPEYEAMGLKDGDQYKQLNTNILQIENEYYSDIRPKRVAFSGEKPLHALRYRGVEYIEVRCLDVNPFHPLGIDETQMDFIDLFLLWCLVQDSPTISVAECELLRQNSQRVAIDGRNPKMKLEYQGKRYPIAELAALQTKSITQFAKIIDEKSGRDCYQKACIEQLGKIKSPDLLLSQRVLDAVQSHQSYREFSLKQSKLFAEHFAEPLTEERMAHWHDEAEQSKVRQKDMESAEQVPFDEFLTDYLRQ